MIWPVSLIQSRIQQRRLAKMLNEGYWRAVIIWSKVLSDPEQDLSYDELTLDLLELSDDADKHRLIRMLGG